jgi:hypothetical protein
MKKKLSLESLSVKSFVTGRERMGGIQGISINICPELSRRTCGGLDCTWYSELYTACNCPESELQPCNTNPNCV